MIAAIDTDFLPQKAWFSLKEACELKGLNYKTALNKKELQPPMDGHIGGRKLYKRSTIVQWLMLTDEDIQSGKIHIVQRQPPKFEPKLDLDFPLSLLRRRAAV
jgi:hypothetical protein